MTPDVNKVDRQLTWQKKYKVTKRVAFGGDLPRNNTRPIVEVTCIRQSSQRAYRVVTREFGKTLHEVVQLVNSSVVICKKYAKT